MTDGLMVMIGLFYVGWVLHGGLREISYLITGLYYENRIEREKLQDNDVLEQSAARGSAAGCQRAQ